MPEETVVSPDVSTGLDPQQGSSQESSTGVQAQPEIQSDTSTSVDRGDSQQSSQGEPRPFERIAGRKFDKIEKTLKTLTELVQRQSMPQSGSPQPQTRQRYQPTSEDWKNPEAVIQKMLDDRLQEFPEKITQSLDEREKVLSFKRSEQDAVKMIETNEAIKRDPEGIDRMRDILEDGQFGLNKMAKHYPLEAARAALEIYNARYSSGRRSGAPSKSQMTSTATAVNSGAGKTGSDAKLGELMKKATIPGMMKNPAFIKELNEAVAQSKTEDRLKVS